MIEINYQKCGYCGACVGVCEPMVLQLMENMVVVTNENKCKKCKACEIVCPLDAIKVKQ
ncbi:ATP-binding protein [Methanocaldococcus infernus]